MKSDIIHPCLRDHSIPFNTLFAQAVLSQKAGGRVFVDDVKNPNAFYISHPYGMSLLFGETENEEFNCGLKEYLLDSPGSRMTREWLQVYPASWNGKLYDLMDHRVIKYSEYPDEVDESAILKRIKEDHPSHIIQWERVNFKFRNPACNNVKIDCGYRLSKIDSRTYDLISGTVVPANFWKDKETFLTFGTGYIVADVGRMVSASFSSFFEGNKLELGVETYPTYRGRGFAKTVCAELIDHCSRTGLEPVWSCNRMNVGSYGLARSLGFDETLSLPYYELIRRG